MPRRKKRAGAGRRGRPSALSAISTSDLQRELERRQSQLQDLVRRRDELSAELSAIENEIAQLQPGASNGVAPAAAPARGRRGRPRKQAATAAAARPSGGRGRRPRNATSLVEALREVLTGNTYSVTEAAEAVQKAGYQTTSPNFRTIVNQALLANPKIFKKVARGQYTAR